MHLANYHKSDELSIPFWDESGVEFVDLERGF